MILSVDRDELNAGRFVRCPTTHPRPSRRPAPARSGSAEWAVIVDHEAASARCRTGRSARSGSAAKHGHRATGTSRRRRSATFQNILKSRTSPSHAEGAADDATWVRTGDSARSTSGELFITGRTKDLVIIDGRNHYPQDLEYSAQEATKACAPASRGLLGAGQSAARRGVRRRARRSQARRRRHLRATGDRGRAGRRARTSSTLGRGQPTPSAPPSRCVTV